MRAKGVIFEGWTIAEVKPAFTASCRKTEFSTIRAAGLRPKEMLLTPKVVCTPG